MAAELTQPQGLDNTAWVTYVNPIVIIRKDSDPDFTVRFDQLNASTYDHGKLCKIVAALSLPAIQPLRVLVCFDGALAIPVTTGSEDADTAVEQFNHILCSLLIGGITCEAVDWRDVVWGKLDEHKQIYPVDFGPSLNAHTHALLRMGLASKLDIMRLANVRNVSVSKLQAAYDQGNAVLQSLRGFTPTFLLRGYTELRYHNYSDALASLWVCVEQLTALLWSRYFLAKPELHVSHLSGRKDSLKNDTRTWSTGVRQELLYQIGVIDENTFVNLFPARKARNDLVHAGVTPDSTVVSNLYDGVLGLVKIITGMANLGIEPIDNPDSILTKPWIDGKFDDWQAVSDSFGI
jgi:hypothetical protein